MGLDNVTFGTAIQIGTELGDEDSYTATNFTTYAYASYEDKLAKVPMTSGDIAILKGDAENLPLMQTIPRFSGTIIDRYPTFGSDGRLYVGVLDDDGAAFAIYDFDENEWTRSSTLPAIFPVEGGDYIDLPGYLSGSRSGYIMWCTGMSNTLEDTGTYCPSYIKASSLHLYNIGSDTDEVIIDGLDLDVADFTDVEIVLTPGDDPVTMTIEPIPDAPVDAVAAVRARITSAVHDNGSAGWITVHFDVQLDFTGFEVLIDEEDPEYSTTTWWPTLWFTCYSTASDSLDQPFYYGNVGGEAGIARLGINNTFTGVSRESNILAVDPLGNPWMSLGGQNGVDAPIFYRNWGLVKLDISEMVGAWAYRFIALNSGANTAMAKFFWGGPPLGPFYTEGGWYVGSIGWTTS